MILGKLHELYKETYCLSEDSNNDFFDCVRDYYYTEEFQSMNGYIQHGSIDRIQHINSVAYMSYVLAKKLKLDHYRTARGALLHDLFYYDWHDPDPSHRLHGYFHPGFALKNARELSRKNHIELTQLEENIIRRHMFPLTVIPPKFKESVLVCLVDKYVATKEIVICSSKKRSERFFGEVKGR
jgi:uncharacterized protein